MEGRRLNSVIRAEKSRLRGKVKGKEQVRDSTNAINFYEKQEWESLHLVLLAKLPQVLAETLVHILLGSLLWDLSRKTFL